MAVDIEPKVGSIKAVVIEPKVTCALFWDLEKFLEKFYIEKKKVNLGVELGFPDHQSDCSTIQATVPHTDHG